MLVSDAAAAEVARLLHAERSTVAELRAEMGDALSCVVPTESRLWQSPAQRAYAARLDELVRLVQAARGQLGEAVEILDSAIARISASGGG